MSVLGQKVEYPQQYTPEILVRIPRQENRTDLNLSDDNLPFVGKDIWHIYEVSFLTKNGLPIVGVIKISIPCNNRFIVESKSLKLYFNSFNMTLFGENRQEAITEVECLIKKDVSELLECDIEINFIAETSDKESFSDDFSNLEKNLNTDSLKFDVYNEDETLLVKSKQESLVVTSDLLRSNCKVTTQPDWGTVFISMQGDETPTKESLLKYIISFRNEQHFHEEICETIYERLYRIFSPKNLMVCCIYTRRGGIDICPIRASQNTLLSSPLLDTTILTKKLLRQ
jgi:7-cyano-7-deazaguanine reductase